MPQLSLNSRILGAPIATVALTLAHAVTLCAIISFQLRIGASPLGRWGLVIYTCVGLASIAGLLFALRRRDRQPVSTRVLLTLSIPAAASLMLWLGLTGDYAPWDPFDSDLFGVFLPAYAVAAAAVAFIYGSYRYLLVTASVMLGLSILAGPISALQYGLDSAIGGRTDAVMYVVGAAIAATALIWIRRQLPLQPPDVWPADVVLGLLGSWLLYVVLVWLPQNGDHLAWQQVGQVGLYVPDGGWGLLRAAATYGSLAAGALAVGSGAIRMGAHLLKLMKGQGERR